MGRYSCDIAGFGWWERKDTAPLASEQPRGALLGDEYVFHVFRFGLGFCVFSWNTWNTWNTQLCIPFCIPRGVAQKYKNMYSREFSVYYEALDERVAAGGAPSGVQERRAAVSG